MGRRMVKGLEAWGGSNGEGHAPVLFWTHGYGGLSFHCHVGCLLVHVRMACHPKVDLNSAFAGWPASQTRRLAD